MNALDGGRVGVSAQACGIASAAVREARQYIAGQTSVDDSLRTQWLSLLADSVTELDAGWLLCTRSRSTKRCG